MFTSFKHYSLKLLRKKVLTGAKIFFLFAIFISKIEVLKKIEVFIQFWFKKGHF